jgi:demethylmenaquinone methyltransferase/2-methoxy-6-polyprenyl-1,4-benzoquinol methylase
MPNHLTDDINNERPEDKKRFIYGLFDSIVPTYDVLNHVLSAGIDIRWRKKIFRYIQPVKGKRAIDLCCGTGALSRLLHRKGANVVSLDFSMNMLQRGVEKRALAGSPLAADVCLIPFKDNTFHVAAIAFGVRNIPDLDDFLKEVLRVLKPGGQFAILELSRPGRKIIGHIYAVYLGHILPFIGGIVSGRRIAYQYLSQSIAAFVDPIDLQAMLEKHGFRAVSLYPQTLGIAFIIVSQKEPV